MWPATIVSQRNAPNRHFTVKTVRLLIGAGLGKFLCRCSGVKDRGTACFSTSSPTKVTSTSAGSSSAAESKDVKEAKQSPRHEIDALNVRDSDGRTPLDYVASWGDES